MREYHNCRVAITGGLGFIGSNLAERLVGLGAKVTIIDSSVFECGANPYNIDRIAHRVRLIERDISQASSFAAELREVDVIFNLAGDLSHIHSMRFPARDFEINAVAQFRFLEECVRVSPGVRIVYGGTRQIYGAPEYLPVDEKHPVRPTDFNGINKYAASMYHLMWSKTGALDAVVLCLSNVYGPRMALNIPCQGFLGNYVRRLGCGRALEIFGDGEQLRDPVYIDDVVDALLRAGAASRLNARVFNLGGPEALSLREIAAAGMRAAGGQTPISYRAFPPELKLIDIGSYSSDCMLIARELGWQPQVRFEDGIGRTLAWYASRWRHYLSSMDADPVCTLMGPESSRPAARLRALTQ